MKSPHRPNHNINTGVLFLKQRRLVLESLFKLRCYARHTAVLVLHDVTVACYGCFWYVCTGSGQPMRGPEYFVQSENDLFT
jgi:hypothetical protein